MRLFCLISEKRPSSTITASCFCTYHSNSKHCIPNTRNHPVTSDCKRKKHRDRNKKCLEQALRDWLASILPHQLSCRGFFWIHNYLLGISCVSLEYPFSIPWVSLEYPLNMPWVFLQYSLSNPGVSLECPLSIPWVSLECALSIPSVSLEYSLSMPWVSLEYPFGALSTICCDDSRMRRMQVGPFCEKI